MLSRLSRIFFSRKSKKRKQKTEPKQKPPSKLSRKLTQPSHRPSAFRPSCESGSTSCSIRPEAAGAPSFLQVVCNDSQPVYCMETVPLFKPAAFPPPRKKASETSLYDTAHDEILRERRRASEEE